MLLLLWYQLHVFEYLKCGESALAFSPNLKGALSPGQAGSCRESEPLTPPCSQPICLPYCLCVMPSFFFNIHPLGPAAQG